jgi:hypothetical protein
MTMYEEDSFFSDADYNDLDIQEIGFDRFRLQQGEHKVVIVEDKKLQKKNGEWTYIIKFANDQGKDYTEYLDPIKPEDRQTYTKKGDQTIAQVKAQKRVNILGALGVPKSAIPKLQPGDLTEIEGTLKLYKSNGYLRFGGFTVTKGGAVGTPLRKTEEKPLEGLKDFAAASAKSDADFGL